MHTWKSVTTDPYVLNCISGFKLEFTSVPYQSYIPNPIKFAKGEFEAVDYEVERLLKIGAIVISEHESGEFISNIFTRTKANGKIRIILNLKPLNRFIAYEHFKMEHLDFVCDLVNTNDWFGSIDLSDAYFSVPIDQAHCKYLKFLWRDKLYMYKVMVFGLCSAPRIFTRICKPLLAMLRGTHHVRCSLYIDDMIIMGKTRDEVKSKMAIASNLLQSLGFTINCDKSVFVPSQVITHLGFQINSVDMSVSLPKDKIATLRKKCKLALKQSNCISIREVASLVGVFIAYCQGCKWGKLFYRDLERDKIKALKSSKGDFDTIMSISQEGIANIEWWLSDEILIPEDFGVHRYDAILCSDASLQGWGGFCGEIRTGGMWSSTEQAFHINWLELKACWLSLKALAPPLCKTIMVKLDNTCAMYYIQNKGGRIKELDHLAKQVWLWCRNRKLDLKATYLPGVLNQVADHESRHFKLSSEWSLNPTCFEIITQHFGVPSVDLFASRLNYKVDQYVAWRPDPDSSATDAFCQDWSEFSLCYAFPPFSLVGKVVNKCIADKAELLLVAPFWTTQYWFPMVMDCVISYPLPLPANHDTVFLPNRLDMRHPIIGILNLHCFRLSGKR